ncbi:GSCOCT00004109001.3-RA-CDS [Cotesia congregata]|uniref:Odorant receptor n=1 Tax=Cotesia congregata TaxID=51543 RepID=A0A8J2H9J7_COTCN|nr:GSCOCT00004109001.3-RA-CDS [Cotesia congregata]CAG5082318.1 olfactory receptor 94 [Cotesia congregata]
MNLFDDLYWRATRIHLSVIGAWPFQSYITSIIIRTVVCFLFESLYISEVIKLVEVWGDLKLTLECIPILVLHSITQVKILNVHVNLNKMKNLLLRIKSDWESGLLDESEIEFLRNDGRKHKDFMSLYFIILYSSTISYELMPLIPVALDIILPLNESRARIFLYQAEYFVEPEKNLTFIYIHSYIVSPLIAITFIGTDSLYSAFIQHACSMFTIIGRRLQNLRADESTNKKHKFFKTNRHVKDIIICIKMHKNVLEFVRLLEEHYTNYLLVILGILVLGLSAIGFRVFLIDGIEGRVQCISYFFGHVAHLFFLSYFGQRLINFSEYVHESICRAELYKFSSDMKPMIILLMMRSKLVSKITAGKLYIMSLENFTTVAKTSFSYFTVLTSFQ